ncbi:phosphomevalonate kinase [Streptococcus dentapri]|uniref:phosphomevalonate kinase n=1 Tax=Streptococcus dentapri TaxID=573564 RepID=A0ABV8D150_9STRE
MTEFRVQTGGKLYLAGEYAVLTPGQSALIKNIPIYMTATIQSAASYHLYSDMFDYGVGLDFDKNYALIQTTVEVVNDYLSHLGLEPHPFSLKITGKLEKDGKKIGIGSSGSVTVLVVKAMAALYGQTWPADLLFKLSAYSLLKTGDNGSMGDLACIVYDDLVLFTSFDRRRIRDWMEQQPLQEVLARDWSYEIKTIKPAVVCDFLVGWTGQPAISKDMINQVKSTITADFLKQTQAVVLDLAQGLEVGNQKQILISLTQAGDLLKELHPAIYTSDLLNLTAAAQGLEVAAKSSGSGGGDCGIALSFNHEHSQTLIERWRAAGIELLSSQML